MKKILLSLMLLGAFATVKAQVVLNEIYGNPGSGNSEFVELFNSGAAENLGCYTLLVYVEGENGADQGWYVLDFPTASSIPEVPGFFVLSSASSFSVQGTSGASANLNWNDAAFRSGATGGYLKLYEWTGGTAATATYTEVNITGVSVTNLLDGTLNGGQFYFTLLYKDGVLVNGFVGGGDNADLTSYGIPLGTLPIDMAGACADFGAFDDLIPMEFHNPSGGNDNGYAREFDGKCGTWTKTAPGIAHTPGVTNGLATGEAGEIQIAQLIDCSVPRRACVDITGITGTLISESIDFPVRIRIYQDGDFNGIPDGPAFDSADHTSVNQDSSCFFLSDANSDFIISYQTQRGCFDRQEVLSNECATLPVNLKFFTATRVNTNVGLVWATATEENNKGFYIQRRIGSGAWVTVGFVPSQAFGGNSFNLLRYEFTDNNPARGITQYRLRQVDIDGKVSVSNIRAVRGMAQRSNVIIYPNPSNDGKVNVVFEDVNAVRNVSLMDMSGRMLKQWKNVTNNNIQIDNLTPGFYSVRIENTETGELAVEKIVVNKR